MVFLFVAVEVLLGSQRQLRAQTPKTTRAQQQTMHRDAVASALVRLLGKELDKKILWEWEVVYQPQYGVISVRYIQEVSAFRPSAINGSFSIDEKPAKLRPEFSLRVESFVSPVAYKRFKAENIVTHARMERMTSQMDGIGHKFDSFAPKNEAEKKQVEAYNTVKKSLHSLPDYYFRDISLSWMLMGYGSLLHQPGDTPGSWPIPANDYKAEKWQREQNQVVETLLSLLSRYEPSASR